VDRAIVTDIEGTTSSISFVKDVLFPYARKALPAFVRLHAQEPEVRKWLDLVAAEVGGAARTGCSRKCCRAGSTRTASIRR
jgi:enolase-phosphatase E1